MRKATSVGGPLADRSPSEWMASYLRLRVDWRGVYPFRVAVNRDQARRLISICRASLISRASPSSDSPSSWAALRAFVRWM